MRIAPEHSGCSVIRRFAIRAVPIVAAIMRGMRRLVRVLPFVSLGILALIHFRTFFYWDFDDAFIVYRMVRNLVDHGEWAFNPGERFNASTSVLNTALVWTGSYVFGSIPIAAHVVGAISIFLASVLCFELMKKDFGREVSLLAAAAVSWTLAHNSTWGLEGYLFVFLLFLFVYLESAKMDSWICLGFLTLARPDGLVMAGMRWLAGVIVWHKTSVTGLCRYAAVLAPWAVFSIAVFGQVFPETLSNKMWQGRSGFWGNGWIYLAALKEHIIHLPKAQVLLFLAAPLGAVALVKAKNPLTYLWVFVGVQQAVYCLLNVPGYHWYLQYPRRRRHGRGVLRTALAVEVPLEKPVCSSAAGWLAHGSFCHCIHRCAGVLCVLAARSSGS